MHALDAEQITALIVAGLPDAKVSLEDLTGTSDHWSATIVWAGFDGLSRIKRHKIVYAALAEPMKGPIHALALKTLAPGEV